MLTLLLLVVCFWLARCSEDEICDTIANDSVYLRRASLALGCCTGRDCQDEGEDEDCKSIAHKLLKPCLRNANATCLAETIAVLEMSPLSPCKGFAKTCQYLKDSKKSLEETRLMVCPPQSDEEERPSRIRRVVACEFLCTFACTISGVPCGIAAMASLGLVGVFCATSCVACVAAAMANVLC